MVVGCRWKRYLLRSFHVSCKDDAESTSWWFRVAVPSYKRMTFFFGNSKGWQIVGLVFGMVGGRTRFWSSSCRRKIMIIIIIKDDCRFLKVNRYAWFTHFLGGLLLMCHTCSLFFIIWCSLFGCFLFVFLLVILFFYSFPWLQFQWGLACLGTPLRNTNIRCISVPQNLDEGMHVTFFVLGSNFQLDIQ